MSASEAGATPRRARRARGPSLRQRLAAGRIVGALPLDRLGHHLSLVAFVATGHVLALMLMLVVPIYADGVNSRLLQEALVTPPDELRPRNSVVLKHYSSLYGPVDADGFTAADAYLTRNLPAVLGLPAAPVQAFVYSDKFRLFPADLAADLGGDPIAWSSVGFDETLSERIEMVEGRLPQRRPDGDPIEAVLSQRTVNKYGLRPGDRLILRGREADSPLALPIELTGVWRPTQPLGTRWPLQPTAYDDLFIVARATFEADVAPPMGQAAWYSLLWQSEFPRESVTVNNAGSVRAGFAELQGRSSRLLNGRVDLESPDRFLQDFQAKATTLRTLLYIFSIPTLMIVLLYILATGSLFAERQRAEIAVLKGRGAGRGQILGAYLVEGALVDLLPLILGPLAAFGAALLIGRTEAFLDFGQANTLPLRMTLSTARLALLVLAGTLLLGTLPVMIAAQQTLISYQQQVVRATRRPLWQRLYLDVLVLLAAGYGYYTLRRQGSLVALGVGPSGGGDPFSNPLSLLLPATALFGCSLLVVRVFPLLAALLARVGRRVFGATTLLALRHLARSPEQGRSIVLLTVLTLALGTFSASMATTLDRNDIDRIMYATGGDLRISEQAELSQTEERWTVLPPWEHGQVPGVEAWSRVRISEVQAPVGGGQNASGALIALDRAGFHAGGWWRDDLARESMGDLMNILAAEPQAIIVSRQFLSASRLRLGDTLTLAPAEQSGAGAATDFVIRGAVDSFPMVYPKPGQFFFVANYNYVYLAVDPAGYDVVLKLAPGADAAQVVAGVEERGYKVQGFKDATALVQASRERPERTGFVGLLSLGFVAAAGLTMLALLLYSLFSFRRRMVEIGVLRAAGLSLGQLFWLLAFELCFLTLTSAVAGTALGVAAARLFVPFYQLGATVEARTPTFLVMIAWNEIGRLLLILGAMLLLTLLATTLLLRRLRIHEAIKLGQELG